MLVKVAVSEVLALARSEAAKRSAREGTCVVRVGLRKFELLRESGAGSVKKPERGMCSTLLPTSAPPMIPAAWRKAASCTGKGVSMRIERKG